MTTVTTSRVDDLVKQVDGLHWSLYRLLPQYTLDQLELADITWQNRKNWLIRLFRREKRFSMGKNRELPSIFHGNASYRTDLGVLIRERNQYYDIKWLEQELADLPDSKLLALELRYEVWRYLARYRSAVDDIWDRV